MSVSCMGGLLYAVRSGETLFTIAGKFGVTVQQLLAANPGINPQNLQIGQILCIPGVAASFCPGGRLHTVTAGETMSSIAAAEGVTLAALIQANPQIPNPNLIFPGEQLCVPAVRPTVFPCCIVLQPTAAAPGLGIGGVVLLEQVGGFFRVTFTGVTLPDPPFFGNFDGYLGRLVFREMVLDTQLFPTPASARPAWTGVLFTGVAANAANLVTIAPFNRQTGQVGPDILSASVLTCCRQA
ncbi:MAG: LysM peptidoglycan-binding domain-containing protein [Firmicutes bacterium]|nr:LysM peptidoglycan-binding domain-containing protein [Bacillota bacterium]